jgi:hypothetical protein
MDHSVNPCFYPTACSVEGAYLPSLDKMRFVAFSNFASVFRGFFRAQESVSLRQLYSAVSKVCRMSWAEVNEVCVCRTWRLAHVCVSLGIQRFCQLSIVFFFLQSYRVFLSSVAGIRTRQCVVISPALALLERVLHASLAHRGLPPAARFLVDPIRIGFWRRRLANCALVDARRTIV